MCAFRLRLPDIASNHAVQRFNPEPVRTDVADRDGVEHRRDAAGGELRVMGQNGVVGGPAHAGTGRESIAPGALDFPRSSATMRPRAATSVPASITWSDVTTRALVKICSVITAASP